MFDVLVFVYENYWRGDTCPQWEHLGRKLSAMGFEADDITQAIAWLRALSHATRHARENTAPTQPSAAVLSADDTPTIEAAWPQSPGAMRIWSAQEQARLGPECWGFLRFLESAGVLEASMREIVLERAMAASSEPLSLEDLKIILLMVYWSFGEEPDALILDELCDDASTRIAH